MSAMVESTDGARQMTITAISQIIEPPRGSSSNLCIMRSFGLGRAATGAAASSDCCRTVSVGLCYEASGDINHDIGYDGFCRSKAC